MASSCCCRRLLLAWPGLVIRVIILLASLGLSRTLAISLLLIPDDNPYYCKGRNGEILFSYRLCLKVIDSVCIKVSLITFHRIHYRIPVEIKRCRYCVKQKCFKTWVYKSYIYFNSLFYLPLLPQMNILNSNIEVNGGYHFDD